MRLIQNALLFLGMLIICPCAHAQKNTKAAQNGKGSAQKLPAHKSHRKDRYEPACHRAYIGLSTGINNPVGLLGLQIDLAFTPNFSVCPGFGLSSWGYKAALEGRYYFSPCNRGWAVAAGITYNTGGTGVTVKNVETVRGDLDVVVDLKSQTAFMVSAYYFFSLGMNGTNRFHLQAGYSIPFSEAVFSYQSNPIAPALTDKGVNTIRALAPGGPIVGLGFSFGTGTSR